MAYSGYRIKIDGTIFPNNDMAKGSYSFSKSPRVSKSWEDLKGITHKTYYPDDKTVISFSIREHLATDHGTFANFFSSRSVTVQYWDDNANDYDEGTFDIESFEWGHITVKEDGAFYGATKITLTEQ
jgi:hypothetical protein